MKKHIRYATYDIIDNEEVKQGLISVDDKDFKGDIYYKFYDYVEHAMILDNGVIIKDDNYKWLEFYKYGSNLKLTAVYDDKDNIIEWYFDYAREIGIENGIPYEDDLFLDVVLRPNGEVISLDEDELLEAYEDNDLTKEEYDNAFKVRDELISKIEFNAKGMKDFTNKYLEFAKNEVIKK